MRKKPSKLTRKQADSDSDSVREKKTYKKDLSKLKKMAKALEREGTSCTERTRARRVLLHALVFDKYSELKLVPEAVCPSSIFRSLFYVDSGFLGLHLLERVCMSYADALCSAAFLKLVALLNAQSLVDYLHIIGGPDQMILSSSSCPRC